MGCKRQKFKRLGELEEENRRLKQIPADLLLESGAEKCESKEALTPTLKHELVVALRG